jgi:hypothetical protein
MHCYRSKKIFFFVKCPHHLQHCQFSLLWTVKATENKELSKSQLFSTSHFFHTFRTLLLCSAYFLGILSWCIFVFSFCQRLSSFLVSHIRHGQSIISSLISRSFSTSRVCRRKKIYDHKSTNDAFEINMHIRIRLRY